MTAQGSETHSESLVHPGTCSHRGDEFCFEAKGFEPFSFSWPNVAQTHACTFSFAQKLQRYLFCVLTIQHFGVLAAAEICQEEVEVAC